MEGAPSSPPAPCDCLFFWLRTGSRSLIRYYRIVPYFCTCICICLRSNHPSLRSLQNWRNTPHIRVLLRGLCLIRFGDQRASGRGKCLPAAVCRAPRTNKQTNNPTGKKLKFASAFFFAFALESNYNKPDRKKMLEKKIAALQHTKVFATLPLR
jgi:hypothetical protein